MSTKSILEQRRIEAGVLKHVYDTAERKVGKAKAREILGEAVTQAAIEQGKTFATQVDGAPDLADFYAILPNWTKEGALEIEVLDAGPNELAFNVTRCRYCEMYTEMGLREIGDLLSCNRDGDFCIGYNPEIELTRTQTIMQGASHCDFRYKLASKRDG